MNDLLKSFPERPPFIFNAVTVGLPALLIFSLFLTFDPIGFNKLELANRVVMYVMLGLLSLFGGLLVGGFFRWISSRS
ncbi:hypothetical protein [Gracilimonas halophila]|uniref:Uncharacterized protein n=1 Tax=Gracilimonas halophila TaxID=1834464 RepID=A0ABW5JJ07_9BACT